MVPYHKKPVFSRTGYYTNNLNYNVSIAGVALPVIVLCFLGALGGGGGSGGGGGGGVASSTITGGVNSASAVDSGGGGGGGGGGGSGAFSALLGRGGSGGATFLVVCAINWVANTTAVVNKIIFFI